MSAAPNFNRVSSLYRALEYLAFARDLERVRFHFLDELRNCRSVLVLGEGDGRCLVRLLKAAPGARVRCVDGSAAMIAAAQARLAPTELERVTFTCADIAGADLRPGPYDAVVTLFFLDCFTTAEVSTLAQRVKPLLSGHAVWLFGDFVVPPRGWRRWRAQVWLAVLYTFFRWETGLRVNRLPDSESVIASAGFAVKATRTWQHGLLRATVYVTEPATAPFTAVPTARPAPVPTRRRASPPSPQL